MQCKTDILMIKTETIVILSQSDALQTKTKKTKQNIEIRNVDIKVNTL